MSLLYTYLISIGSIWCWLFAFLSGSLFLILCFQKRIYAELALQVFYIAMAIYGYLNWGEGLSEAPDPLNWHFHLGFILGTGLLVLASGLFLSKWTDSKLPYLDSFTTLFSILATILMVQLFASNWLYWIVIDAVSILLYYRRGLKLSAALFLIYTFMAINGYLQWTQLL